MIRLFVSDIDGCLAMPYEPFDLTRLGELARASREAGPPCVGASMPAVSICSGRSYAYVEAMAQLLAVSTPVLFESGAGMFDMTTGLSTLHPDLSPKIVAELFEIRSFMESIVLARPGLSVDYGKRAQAGLVGTVENGLFEVLDEITPWVSEHFPNHNTFHTHISIDVVPAGLTKKEGLEWLGRTVGVSLEEIAFIGDTNGDIGAMQACGYSFAPKNAQSSVKAIADHVSNLDDIGAVLEAYELAVAR